MFPTNCKARFIRLALQMPFGEEASYNILCTFFKRSQPEISCNRQEEWVRARMTAFTVDS